MATTHNFPSTLPLKKASQEGIIFSTGVTKFHNAAQYNVNDPDGRRCFVLEIGKMTDSQRTTLIDFFTTLKGKAYSFNFTHPSTLEVIEVRSQTDECVPPVGEDGLSDFSWKVLEE